VRIGIIAAVPGELKPLVRGWTKMPVARGSGIAMWQAEQNGDQMVAVCAGMGAAAARRAFIAAEYLGALDLVLSVGWAGGTRQDFPPGACYAVAEIVDMQTGERFAGLPGGSRFQMKLATSPCVVDSSEKRRLWDAYNAGLVDMEGATVARLAQMRGIPVICFKAVSDGVDSNLPDLNPFIDVHGQLRMGAFLAHIAARPLAWPRLALLGVDSSRAAKALARVVSAYLDCRDVDRSLTFGASAE
jgi:adenosylhomocysteine nucleosidase